MKTTTSQPLRSLAQTLTIAFLVLSVIALAADGVITLYNNIIAQRENIVAQQQVVAQNASREVNGFFEEKFKALRRRPRSSNYPEAQRNKEN